MCVCGGGGGKGSCFCRDRRKVNNECIHMYLPLMGCTVIPRLSSPSGRVSFSRNVCSCQRPSLPSRDNSPCSKVHVCTTECSHHVANCMRACDVSLPLPLSQGHRVPNCPPECPQRTTTPEKRSRRLQTESCWHFASVWKFSWRVYINLSPYMACTAVLFVHVLPM